METFEQVDKLLDEGKTIKEIRDIIEDKDYDIPAAKYRRKKRLEKVKKEDGYNMKYDKPVLVFSDTHIPFQHRHFLKFLKDIDNKFGCDDQKICTGDLVDNHAISRHTTEDGAMSPEQEYLQTRTIVKAYSDTFPSVKMCIGNHDAIAKRAAKEIGLYSGFLRNLNETWDLPNTWEVEVDHYYKDVLYTHGLNCGGVMGVRNTAIKEGISTVIGHYHSHACVHYIANKTKMIFGANAGCGIDVHSYAFQYGKHFKDKPTIGCIVVFSPTWAIFVPMDIDYYNEKYGH